MNSSESFLIIVTVEGNVIRVLSAKLLHHLVDVIHAASTFTHCLSGEVGVTARSVPVLEELGGEGDGHIEVLSDTLEKITRYPQVVSHGDAFNGTNLVFPLAWHNLSVGTTDVDSGGEASAVVLVGDDSAEGHVGTDGAVVGSLWAWVTVGWPAEWPFCELVGSSEEGEFLLDSEPWFFQRWRAHLRRWLWRSGGSWCWRGRASGR